jgi:Flp pilus assembly protein TadD
VNNPIIKINSKISFLILLGSFIFLSSLGLVFAEEVLEGQAKEYLKEGIEAQKTGDMDFAISLYAKATYIKPDYAMAHNNLGTAYAQKGDLAKAEEEYKRAIAINPNYSVALKNMAIIYAEKGDQKKFFEYWKRATGIDVYSPFLIDDEEKD